MTSQQTRGVAHAEDGARGVLQGGPSDAQRKPLAIDLFCGLGGWTEGLLAEGYEVIGFDIEQHVYGEHRYPAQLVVQDVLTLHGSQFKDAALIVASPPCQEYSYMAMPWSRAKQIAREYRDGIRDRTKLTALFDACFRLQSEACEAAGRHIPLVVENVRGAIPWVGRSRWNYGSFHLWGDTPALMPIQKYHERLKCKAGEQWNVNRANYTGTRGWDEGVKQGGDWFNASQPSMSRLYGSKSPQRKMASAMIAKIPLPLSRHIAATYRPAERVAA